MDIPRREFARLAGGGAAGLAIGAPFARGVRRRPDWRLSDDFLDGLEDRLAGAGVPGAAIAVGGLRGEAAIHDAGHRAGPGSAPVAVDTVFAGASLSKPVLATIALSLHRSGDFDLDRPFADFLVSDLPTGDGAARLTARMALRHTSGLPNWRFVDEPLVVQRPVGSEWGYSGEGYVLVQRALEATTGRGLEALARSLVFEPIRMASSSYLALPWLDASYAAPHVSPDDRFEAYAALLAWKERAVVAWMGNEDLGPEQLTQARLRTADTAVTKLAGVMSGRDLPDAATVPNFIVPNGAGSLRTTAADYLLFMRHWLADAGLRELAFANPAQRTASVGWGAGWGLEGTRLFWHWGETLGVRTLACADVEQGAALVVLTNGDGGMDIAKAAVRDATGSSPAFLDLL